jgi:hypothetical protein
VQSETLVSSYENSAFFYLFRYDLENRTAKCLLFVKAHDTSRQRQTNALDILEVLESQRLIIDRHPLMVLNGIFPPYAAWDT